MQHIKVLVVNQGYQPICAISWEKAMCLIFREKAEIVSVYEGLTIRSAHKQHEIPSVVRLINLNRRRFDNVKFSRNNVYIRDKHTCQYCGNHKSYSHLTFDHVVPRSQGGKTSWTNIVTACRKCNESKADKNPHQVNMTLLSKPRIPSIHENMAYIFSFEQIPKEWHSWIKNIS